MTFCLDRALAESRIYAIRQAAGGNQDALDYLLRDFIRVAKQGGALDPEVARVVADVLERVLAGETIGEILGTQAKRGRPREYKNAIVVHAAVRSFMLQSQQLGRTQLRRDDATEEVAQALEMHFDTVQENYKRVSKLIKKIKDNPNPFFDFKRSYGYSGIEEVYLLGQENAVLLLEFMSAKAASRIQQAVRRPLLEAYLRRLTG